MRQGRGVSGECNAAKELLEVTSGIFFFNKDITGNLLSATESTLSLKSHRSISAATLQAPLSQSRKINYLIHVKKI